MTGTAIQVEKPVPLPTAGTSPIKTNTPHTTAHRYVTNLQQLALLPHNSSGVSVPIHIIAHLKKITQKLHKKKIYNHHWKTPPCSPHHCNFSQPTIHHSHSSTKTHPNYSNLWTFTLPMPIPEQPTITYPSSCYQVLPVYVQNKDKLPNIITQ